VRRYRVFERGGLSETGGKRVSLDRIEEAVRVIDPAFLGSPQLEAEALGDKLGSRLVCKVETVNPIRSFKGRGTDYLLYRLRGERSEGLVCASAGNFGQGLAYAARKSNTPLTVFAARGANPHKVERMRRLGAEVRLEGEDFDEAKAAARALAESEGSRFVEDGREAEIAEGAPAMALSLQEGVRKTTEKVDTIADGIAVRIPVEEALSDLSGVVDDVLLVDDGTIVRAMRLLFWKMGLVVEPAGAAGVAALLSNRERFAGALVATPLCGSNLTDEQVHQWLLDARSGEEE
jgi:threonine dehydratase